MNATGERIGAGQVLPDFSLVDVDGRRVRLSDYRQRRNVVLVLVHGLNAAIEGLLGGLAAQVERLAEDAAQPLVVVAGPSSAAVALQQMYGLPFPVLADTDGGVHAALGVATEATPSVAVFVTTRAARLVWAYRPEDGPPAPTVDDIRGWLGFMEMQCWL